MTVSSYTQIVGIFINIPVFYKFINKLINDEFCSDKYLLELIKITSNFNVEEHTDFDELDYEDDIETIRKSKIIANYLNKKNVNGIFKNINKFVVKIAPHSYSNCANINNNHIIIGLKLQYINNSYESDCQPGHMSDNEPDIDLINTYATEFKSIMNEDFPGYKVKLFTVPNDCFCCS
jgi:hypothetical protein